MSQLEQIEARIEEAERKKDEASKGVIACRIKGIDPVNHSDLYCHHEGGAHAYTQAAALARPLQEGVDAIRHDLWDLATNEEGAIEDYEYCTKNGAPISAAIFKGRADAFHFAVITLHESLELAGLC